MAGRFYPLLQSARAVVSCSLQLYIKRKTYAMTSEWGKACDVAVTVCPADNDFCTTQFKLTPTQASFPMKHLMSKIHTASLQVIEKDLLLCKVNNSSFEKIQAKAA